MGLNMPSSLWPTSWRWTVGRSWRSITCLKLSWSSWKQETGKRHFLQSYPSGKELFLHTQSVSAPLRTSSPRQKDGAVPARESIAGMTPTHHRRKSRASRAAQCPQWVLSHSDQPSLAVLHCRRTQRGWYHQILRLQENPFSLITVVEFEVLSRVNDNGNSLNTKEGLFGFLWEDLKVSFQSCFKPQIRVMESVTVVLGLIPLRSLEHILQNVPSDLSCAPLCSHQWLPSDSIGADFMSVLCIYYNVELGRLPFCL